MKRLAATAATLTLICGGASAQVVDFTTFTTERFTRTNGFPAANWLNTAPTDDEPSTAQLDDTNPFTPSQNASANIHYGADSVLGKRITGQLAAGTDDDVIGFALGFNPGDTQNFNADYLLIDWKGADQTFDFTDVPEDDVFFHDATIGGLMPAGLAVSRVSGFPNADELWQHIDSEDALDGGVTELQRGRTLGAQGYRRTYDAPHEFDITYTSNRLTVIVDGALELDVTGSFGDGRFGLYTAWQGPTPIFSDFEITDAVSIPSEFPTASIDRETGEVTITNPSASPIEFTSYEIISSAGSLDTAEWLSITDNYDTGVVDDDAWQIDESLSTVISESETGGTDGGTLAPGQTLSLGDIWTASRFEDLTTVLQFPPSAAFPEGLQVPLATTYTGNGGAGYEAADLNADGSIDLADWNLFFPNTLKTFESMTLVGAALAGDLDGDFDNDVNDFALFKADYEAANGIGSFARMLAVPEPATISFAALALATLAARRTRVGTLALLACVGMSGKASAQALDFTTFTLEAFPRITDGFTDPDWTTTATTATITNAANSSPSVLYSPTNLINNRIRGFLEPGTDDDVVGLVYGFQPGDATIGEDSADADYLLLDWKGIDQNFNFGDVSTAAEPFHGLTPGGLMPEGLALSRVNGLANMDELWQHADLVESPTGGVTELQRANTLGSTPYDRFADPLPRYEIDVVWTDNQMIVLVDGVLEAVQSGNFNDGRFGVYTCCQSGGPVYSNFEVLPADSLDLSDVVIFATVDRDSGDIVVSNDTPNAIQFDYYELRSESGSLLTDWSGLADAETGSDATPGLGWVEAGGSSPTTLAELFLEGGDGSSSGRTLAPGQSITFEGAYNGLVNGDDIQFAYRDSSGQRGAAFVEYVGFGDP